MNRRFIISISLLSLGMSPFATALELKSNRVLWSLKMAGRAAETVTLARLDADFGPAFTLTYAIGEETLARQVIGDKAAQDQTRELQVILPPSRRAHLTKTLASCRTTLEFQLDGSALNGTPTAAAPAIESLCLDQLRRPYDERFSKWWLRNRALLGR